MGSPSGQPTATATAAPVEAARPMAKVLVAARDLDAGQRLTDADLAWKDWPVDEVNPAFITDGSVPIPAAVNAPAAAKAGSAVQRAAQTATDAVTGGAKADYFGSVVREPILAGEPIVGRKIVRAGDSGYMAAYLEPGMRAMAIAVTVESMAGGFILPGDRVDVVLSREIEVNGGESSGKQHSAHTVMQNIKVLAIDQSTRAGDDEQAVVGATATLEVTPRDAEALALAKSQGDLSLVLRSYADTAGPSGRTAGPTQEATAVRVQRGGAAPGGGVVR